MGWDYDAYGQAMNAKEGVERLREELRETRRELRAVKKKQEDLSELFKQMAEDLRVIREAVEPQTIRKPAASLQRSDNF